MCHVTCLDLGSGFSCSLSFGSHGSLQLNWQFHIFNFHTLHFDAPVVCGIIQVGLEKTEIERAYTCSCNRVMELIYIVYMVHLRKISEISAIHIDILLIEPTKMWPLPSANSKHLWTSYTCVQYRYGMILANTVMYCIYRFLSACVFKWVICSSFEMDFRFCTCMLWAMPSRSDRTSARFLVPRTFLSVVCASKRVAKSALDTLATEAMGSLTRKYTTPSTETVTESFVRI